MKQINFAWVILVLTLASCENKKKQDIGGYTTTHFTLKNNSGVQVAIVAGNKTFPDSLVLLDGMEYKWEMKGYDLTWPLDGIYYPKVYFDKDILVVYDKDYFPERNPGAGSYYDIVKTDEHNVEQTFSFTPEDYQNALEHTEK